MKKGNNAPVIITISIAVITIMIFFSFTGFEARIQTNDVVSNEQVFVSTNQVAIDNIKKLLAESRNSTNANNENNDTNNDVSQAFGIGIFVDFKDSNGKIIPQDTNFLNIPFTEKYVNVQPASLIGINNELLDFAKIQFDIIGVVIKDTNVQVTVDYELVSNNNVFLTGKAFGTGMTKDNQMNLFFEQGNKVGEVLELDFEKNEVPVVYNDVFFRNTLEVKITKVEAVIGSSFDTKYYNWSGSFPVYVLKFDSDKETNTIRDYRGIAIQTLPNDVGLKVCGYDNGRVLQGQDFSAFAPKITVKKNNVIILESISPQWGSRDADFNSIKCSQPVSGLERNTDYVFEMHDGSKFNVHTSSEPFLYSASCTYKVVNLQTQFPCTSNFGWSR